MPENLATFYGGNEPFQALRVLPVMVRLDGQPAPWLELLEITKTGGPALNRALFRVVTPAGQDLARFEFITRAVQPGREIRADTICPADDGSRRVSFWPLFYGLLASGTGFLSATDDHVELLAEDFLAAADNTVIDHIHILDRNAQPATIASSAIVFNPNGNANCSAGLYSLNGQKVHVFDAYPQTAIPWTYNNALRYLLAAYPLRPAGTQWTFCLPEDLARGQALRDVDITRMRPLAALERLADRARLGFTVDYVPLATGQAQAVLRFFRRGQGRLVYLQHQPAGQTLDIRKTNLARCRLQLHQPARTICLIGRGSRKRFESTFELVEGWDQSLEVNDMNLYSPATNADFPVYKDVFRKYVLNEAGDYTPAPFNQGPAYDLSALLGTTDNIRTRRRFYPCLSLDDAGTSRGYYLEVSYNAGQDWQPYGGSFSLLLDQCGIYLSYRQLSSDEWVAICKDVLRFRITASIDSDECLQDRICSGPLNSLRPVYTETLDLAHEFRYRRVTPGSVFYQPGSAPADEVDDSLLLRDYLRRTIDRLRRAEYAAAAELNFIRPDICPGDLVAGISGRNLQFLSHDANGCSAPQVQRVKMKFAGAWLTEISWA